MCSPPSQYLLIVKSNMHTCSANLCENQVLLVTQFAAKYCTCRQSF